MQRCIPFAFLVLAVAGNRGAWAELKPAEVGIVCMDRSSDSRRVAEQYASLRGVPAENIFRLEGAPITPMARNYWDATARPALRQWLESHPGLRCVVTTQDVPLVIGPRPGDAPAVVDRKRFLQESRKARIGQLGAVFQRLAGASTGQPAEALEFPADLGIKELTLRCETALKQVQEQVAAATDENRRREIGTLMERALLEIGGITAMLRAAKPQMGSFTPDVQTKLHTMQGQAAGFHQGIQALAGLPDSVARDFQLLRLLQPSNGLITTVQWIDSELQMLEKNETFASFDSELALVRWPDYNLIRWQGNAANYRLGPLPLGLPPVLLVARLESTTPDAVLEQVRQSIAAENAGLSGKVYLDARGMPHSAADETPGSYGQYDQSLRTLAARLKEHTDLEVVLDNEPALFQPGTCPDAALYCGWYSLGNYVDAFDWIPGAVGYHLASMEGGTFRDPKSPLWCPAMVRDGVAATLGPTHEPYLAAFPLPDDFFSLLLTGKYTLAETYSLTNPFHSWVMVLAGDPLYNPFRNHPRLNEEDLPDALRRALSGGSSTESPPAVPSEPAPDTPSPLPTLPE